MLGARIRNVVVAGFCGTVAHSLLLLVHNRTGPLPGFQPNNDIQWAVTWLVGTEINPGIAWLLTFVNGAVIWGVIFGQTYRFLPGERPWSKGVFFGLCAWLIMGLLFFPLVGRGIFASELGLGIAPALLMLAAMLTYSVTMSLVYQLLNRLSE
jgi:hypothetical protein